MQSQSMPGASRFARQIRAVVDSTIEYGPWAGAAAAFIDLLAPGGPHLSSALPGHCDEIIIRCTIETQGQCSAFSDTTSGEDAAVEPGQVTMREVTINYWEDSSPSLVSGHDSYDISPIGLLDTHDQGW